MPSWHEQGQIYLTNNCYNGVSSDWHWSGRVLGLSVYANAQVNHSMMIGNATNDKTFNAVSGFTGWEETCVCFIHTGKKRQIQEWDDAKNLHRKKKQGGKVMQRKLKKEISLIKVSQSIQLQNIKENAQDWPWSILVHSVQCSGRWNISEYKCVQPCIITRVIWPLKEPP
jgi:hypothetical protein